MSVKLISVDVGNMSHITNVYIISSIKNNAVIIDPGYDSRKIIDYIKSKELTIKYIVITHAHADHMGALEELINYTNAKVIVHKEDKKALLNEAPNYSDTLNVKEQNIDEGSVITVEEGYMFSVDELNFEVIHTPRSY